MTDIPPPILGYTKHPAPSDPETLARWIEQERTRPEFWQSTPAWSPNVAHRTVDDHEFVLKHDGLLEIKPFPAVVTRFFDGASPLDELAADFAEAAELDRDQIDPVVASVALELHLAQAITGLVVGDVPDTATDDDHEPVASPVHSTVTTDPVDGVATRTEVTWRDGNRVITTYLADGTREVTTEYTYDVGHGEQALSDAERMAAAVMDGRRSPAELVPADSCLGSKLRNDDDVTLLTFVCPDGDLRSVRCHDEAITRALETVAGAHLADHEERGPIEAFVVTPLEGDGPVRIYDGRGSRRGRPRTVDDAVDIVDRLLGEATARQRSTPDGGVVLQTLISRRGDHAILSFDETISPWVRRRTLLDAGWNFTGVRPVLVGDSHIEVPSAFGQGERFPLDNVRLVGVPRDEVTAAMLLTHLVEGLPDGVDLIGTLERLASLADAVLEPLDASFDAADVLSSIG